jgi:hypothetical protein
MELILDSVIFGQDQLPTDGNVLTMTLEKVCSGFARQSSATLIK